MSNGTKFSDWLASGEPILADGAMGTQLHARGIPFDACFDELNLSRPELILEIHREYLEAGARIIETNTFGANQHKLSSHGLEDHVAEINAAGVALAKQAVDETGADALVAGSVGPLGVRLAPFGRVKPEEAFEAFKEQITTLEQAGADLISLETQSDLYELREGIQATKVVGDLPVIASVTFTRDDRTLLGDTPAQVAKSLWEAGADVIGANCSEGPAQLLRIIQAMRRAVPEAKFSVMPNAGWPEQVGGRIMYPATAGYFADYARAYTEVGASIIGGCCGTTADHIAHMREAFEQVDLTQVGTITFEAEEDLERLGNGQLAPTHLNSKLRSREFCAFG